MAKKARFATLTSWSFSVYCQYLKCPFSVCLDKIMRIRIQEPPNEHLERGNRVHDAAAGYLGSKGKAPTISPELVAVKDQLVQLRVAKPRTEQEWAFDRKWQPVDWRDWNNAWLRIKTDVCVDTVEPPTVDIVDWKTGRVHEEHKQQRTLYALGGLLLVKLGKLAGGSKDVKLTAQHVYIDTGQRATENFTMKNLDPLKREWLARTEVMMKDTQFKTKTGPHCRWCKFAKSKGGPCPEDM